MNLEVIWRYFGVQVALVGDFGRSAFRLALRSPNGGSVGFGGPIWRPSWTWRSNLEAKLNLEVQFEGQVGLGGPLGGQYMSEWT